MTPETEEIIREAQFLVKRIREWEGASCDCEETTREWNGHVSPPLARLEDALRRLNRQR